MIKKIILALVAFILLLTLGFVIWGSTPLGPADTALAALESDNLVKVESDHWLTFRPAGIEPTIGLIIYPGGRVDYRSYAPLARLIAQAGYLVIIPPMPLNLAVLDIQAADEVIAAHPEIHAWAIGGHSLGGAMAAQYAANRPEQIRGLLLLAAYPPESVDLSGAQLVAVSVFGSRDQVAGLNSIQSAQTHLPSETTWINIQGGNHAQFGDYGPQPGDGTAQISPEQQWGQAASMAVTLLENLQ